MAKAPTTPTAPAYEPETEYEVTLKRAVRIGATWVRPSHSSVRLKGKVIVGDVAAAIETATPVEA